MDTSSIRIETERLILRPPAPEDFESWAAFAADPEAMHHLGGVQVRSSAWRSFVGIAGSWQMQGFAMFSVIEKLAGQWIGRIGPWMPEGWPGSEVGWSIASKYWGRGYAKEASVAAIEWSFEQLGWHEVIHTISPDNHASKALAASLGSSYLRRGRLPAPIDLDVEIWGQTREQWRARNSSGESAC
ncbi:GNAT family N-acetyltransferase [Dokdonella sp.]|uniref:GNAT family N-acetyltransferase n=1 Tax=Dokdonella sp. TaxID=2291710 RepID=UPI003C3C7E9A